MIPATKTEHTQAPSRAPRRPPARHQPTEQGGMGAFYAGGGRRGVLKGQVKGCVAERRVPWIMALYTKGCRST